MPRAARPSPARFRARRGARPRARRGVTLLELLVVLVVLGLVATVAVPRWRVDDAAAGAGGPLGALLAEARALAVRRAEVLRLSIAPDGAWTLSARDSVLRRGALAGGAPAGVVLVVTPLGGCVPERVTPGGRAGDAARETWDAGTCAPPASWRAPRGPEGGR